MKETIVYEQPLNEIIRVCLRLEQLFLQIDHQLDDTSLLGSRNAVALIIGLLHLLDRPDLKTKLAKELNYLQTNLMRYGNAPEIDTKKLQTLTNRLEEYARNLIDSSGKIGHRLREVELLNTLRLHLASPGSGCSFDVPLYHYWLQQPTSARMTTIKEWLHDFAEIKAITQLVLDLVRKNAKVEDKTAVHGFYQELLDPQSNLRMIRIGIPQQVSAYPEISVGRHFLSVRYFYPDIEKRPTQYADNLSFWIAYCNT